MQVRQHLSTRLRASQAREFGGILQTGTPTESVGSLVDVNGMVNFVSVEVKSQESERLSSRSAVLTLVETEAMSKCLVFSSRLEVPGARKSAKLKMLRSFKRDRLGNNSSI